MLTRTGASLQIDAVHTRAICDEIGDRLRDVLRCQVSHELPPRLQDLMEQLAKADETVSPSIAPSLDEMISQGPARSACETIAALVSSRGRDQQPVKRGSGPSYISFR
jgi:hypothetical protein